MINILFINKFLIKESLIYKKFCKFQINYTKSQVVRCKIFHI